MRARTNPWLAVLTILAGGALAVSFSTVGCGGGVEQTPATTDTGGADTGITIVDSTKPDTGTPMMDSEKTYDVPGSLFDATVPDVEFEGGKTSGGCYACTLDKCKSEVEVCDKDPRCRGLFLCVLTECAGSFTDFGCAAGCAFKFDVTGLSDPVIGKAQAVGNCVQNKCSDKCPNPPMAGDAGSDAPKTDAPKPADAVSDGETGAMGGMGFKFAGSAGGAKDLQSVDPRVVEVLMSIAATFEAAPEARDQMIQLFKH